MLRIINRLLRLIAKFRPLIFTLAAVLIIATAAIIGFQKTDDTPLVTCSANWVLSSGWQELGSVHVSENGTLTIESGDLLLGTMTLSTESTGFSARIKKARDSVHLFVSNVGWSKFGFSFAGIQGATCYRELSPGESAKFTSIQGGRHLIFYEAS